MVPASARGSDPRKHAARDTHLGLELCALLVHPQQHEVFHLRAHGSSKDGREDMAVAASERIVSKNKKEWQVLAAFAESSGFSSSWNFQECRSSCSRPRAMQPGDAGAATVHRMAMQTGPRRERMTLPMYDLLELHEHTDSFFRAIRDALSESAKHGSGSSALHGAPPPQSTAGTTATGMQGRAGQGGAGRGRAGQGRGHCHWH